MTKIHLDYSLRGSVRVLSRDGQHILVNIEELTWAKITDDLWQIVSKLGSIPGEELLASIKTKCPSELVLRSMEFLARQGLLTLPSQGSDSEGRPYGMGIPGVVLGSVHGSQAEETCGREDKALSMENLDVLVDITDRCNYRCPYCYADAATELQSSQREPGLIELSMIAQKLKAVTPQIVTLSGGEPLLRKDIGQIVGILHTTLGCPLKINTNGSLLSESFTKDIAAQVVDLVVSIDGASEEVADRISGRPGSFRQVLEGIEKVQNEGFTNVTISPTVCRQNLDDLPNIIGLAKYMGVEFSFSYLLPTGRARSCASEIGPTEKEEFYLEEKLWRKCLELDFPPYPGDPFYRGFVRYARMRCPVGTSLHVLTDGSMYPCPALIRNDRYYLGNIYEVGDLKETLKSNEAMANLATMHVDYNPRDPKCSECDVRYFCAGWCMGRDIPEDSCYWIREKLRRRLWKYQDGLSLEANIEAMFGET